MTIETRYNLGDEVWVILNNRAQRRVIKDFSIKSETRYDEFRVRYCSKIVVKYYFGDGEYVDETMCFPTKEELLKNL